MSERFDAAVWSGLERRLSEVEAFIPDAPPWHPSTAAELSGTVRLGPTLRPPAGVRPRRTRLVLAFAVIALLLALIAAALVGSLLPDPSQRDEPFGPFGALRQTEGDARAALLPDGRTIIVLGAWQGIGIASARANIWDPVAGFVSIDPPTLPRVNPTTTLLLDGRVLVVGGYGGPYQYSSSAVASAEVWDPETSTFAPTGSMAAARVGHTATVLPDGRVLVVGGAGPEGDAAQAELWDPRTNLFAPAGDLAHPRMGHAAALLLDGRVVVAGGASPIAGTGIAEVEVWDPLSLQFAEGVSLGLGRNLEGPSFHSPKSPSLTRLPDGRVLMAGVYLLPYGSYSGVVVWSPSTGATHLIEMARHRDGHAATLLADGRVLVTGGRSTSGEVLDSVELWDPATSAFRETTPLVKPAANHTAVLLADGRLLIVLDGSGPEGIVDPFIYEPEAIR
jgi:hypothetical protein